MTVNVVGIRATDASDRERRWRSVWLVSYRGRWNHTELNYSNTAKNRGYSLIEHYASNTQILHHQLSMNLPIFDQSTILRWASEELLEAANCVLLAMAWVIAKWDPLELGRI